MASRRPECYGPRHLLLTRKVLCNILHKQRFSRIQDRIPILLHQEHQPRKWRCGEQCRGCVTKTWGPDCGTEQTAKLLHGFLWLRGFLPVWRLYRGAASVTSTGTPPRRSSKGIERSTGKTRVARVVSEPTQPVRSERARCFGASFANQPSPSFPTKSCCASSHGHVS